MRSILPNAANEVISLFKGTSIVSVMAIARALLPGQVIYGRNGRVVPLLMVATVWYIVLTTVLSVVQYYVERHYAEGAATLPPTPLQRLRGTRARSATDDRHPMVESRRAQELRRRSRCCAASTWRCAPARSP